MKITNLTKNTVLAENALIADNPISRVRGLLGRKGLTPQEALVLKPCNSIHTFFMRFPIDVLFVDGKYRVVAVIPALKPYRLSRIYFSACMAIELPSGVLTSSSTVVGDTLLFEHSPAKTGSELFFEN